MSDDVCSSDRKHTVLVLIKYCYSPEMTEDEAYEVIKQCVFEVHSRLFVSLPNFFVKIINKDGIRDMPIITPATYILQAQA